MTRTRPLPFVLALGAWMLLGACPRAGAAAVTDWTGSWQGAIRLDLEWCAARVDLGESKGRIVGRLDVPALGAIDVPIELIVDEGSHEKRARLVFELPEFGAIDLAAALEDGALRSLSGGDWDSPALRLVKPATGLDLDEYSGWYEIEPGSDVLVTPGSEGGLRVFAEGSATSLIAIARDRFGSVCKDTEPAPPRTGAAFVRGATGAVEQLEFDEAGSHRVARRAQLRGRSLESVVFANGPLELRGLLLRPGGETPAPAVVFIGGTGYSTADRLYEMTLAARLLEKGIAVLLADKRGCGGSAGDWRMSTLADLAGDATAAVRFLRTHTGIRPDAIGLWGISEGGWVAPLAASRCPELAFVINHGGPAVPPLEDELDDLSLGIQSVGLPPEEVDVAMTLAASLVDLYASRDALPRFEAALQAARARPWWDRFQSRIPQREDDWRVQWWRKRGQFDSVATWKALRTPALVLIGGKDGTMDLPKNLALFESFRASHPRLEIRVVPNADHGLRVDGELVPGVVEGVADWILGMTRP